MHVAVRRGFVADDGRSACRTSEKPRAPLRIGGREPHAVFGVRNTSRRIAVPDGGRRTIVVRHAQPTGLSRRGVFRGLNLPALRQMFGMSNTGALCGLEGRIDCRQTLLTFHRSPWSARTELQLSAPASRAKRRLVSLLLR